eukprot:gene28586-35469_t
MAAKIKDLERQLDNATQDVNDRKNQGPRIRKGKKPNELFDAEWEIGDNTKKKSRGRPSTAGGGGGVRRAKSSDKGIENNQYPAPHDGMPLWGASTDVTQSAENDNSADAIVRDLLDYEGSLETSSTVDLNDFPGPKRLARQTSTTSTFSEISVGNGFSSRDDDAANETSPTARSTRPTNRTKSVDYFPEQKLTVDTSSAGKTKLDRQSSLGSAGGNDASRQQYPKSLTDHCNVVVQSSDSTSRAASLDFLIKRFGTANGVSINKLYELDLHQTLADMLCVVNNNNLLHKGMVVLNNLIARSTPEQFQRIMQIISVPQLVALIGHRVDGIQEQAIWILDNVALDCGKFRDLVMEAGALPAVLKVAQKQPSTYVSLVISKLLRTLTTGHAFNAAQHMVEIRGIIAAVAKLLFVTGLGTNECLLGACATLNNLTQDEDQTVVAVVFAKHPEVPRRLVELASHHAPSADIRFHAIDTLSHLSSDSDKYTHVLLSLDILSSLTGAVLNVKNPSIASAACHCVSNITAGNSQAIQAVVKEDLFPVLINLMEHSADQNVRLYAAYAVMFAFHGCDMKQTQYLVNAGCIPQLITLLRGADKIDQDNDLTLEALTAIEMLLHKFEFVSDFDHVAAMFETEAGWGESIKRLRGHSDPKISRLAIAIDVSALRKTLFNM